MIKIKNWVYDLETLVNCFIGVFESYTTTDKQIFVIHSTRNDFPHLINFLSSLRKNKCWLFGYNNLAFDSQILEYMFENRNRLLSLSADDLTKDIYNYSQKVIKNSNDGTFADYPEWKLSVPQVDIFKLNHWDNDAKRSSLKWIQYSMDWHNVEEMPHPHYKPVIGTSTLINIVKYCVNDVASTKAIFCLPDMKEQIKLRAALSKEYGLKLYSASEPRISKEMFIHFLSEKLGRDRKEIKALEKCMIGIRSQDCRLKRHASG